MARKRHLTSCKQISRSLRPLAEIYGRQGGDVIRWGRSRNATRIFPVFFIRQLLLSTAINDPDVHEIANISVPNYSRA